MDFDWFLEFIQDLRDMLLNFSSSVISFVNSSITIDGVDYSVLSLILGGSVGVILTIIVFKAIL